MSDRIIDYDRPCVIRVIGDLNMEVFMYKDDPGVFLNAWGKPVGDELAARAGYDVAAHKKAKLRKERMTQAAHAIAEEFEEGSKGQTRVVAELAGFKVVEFGANRHRLEDPDGNVLTPGVALSLDTAKKLLRQLATPQAAQADEAIIPPPDGAPAGARLGLGRGRADNPRD